MYEELIERYYRISIIDYNDGVTIDELRGAIQLFEDLEEYEACAGILKAIKELE